MNLSPEAQMEESHEDSKGEDTTPDPQAVSRSASQKGPRKRTKTGCLTCRKRRIKCGEQKPICANCSKSKRFCEGYNPRVSYRGPPTTSSDSNDFLTTKQSLTSNFAPFGGFASAGLSSHPLRPIAPTPLQLNQRNFYGAVDFSHISLGGPISPAFSNDTTLGIASSVPLSADALRSFPTGLQYDTAPDTQNHLIRPLHRHASVSGPHPEFPSWAGAFDEDQSRSRVAAGRSNTLATLDLSAVSQLSAEAFTAISSTSYPPTFQLSGQSDFDTPLTSTQIAAYDDQPFAPDHPFYPDLRAQISDPRLDVATREDDPRRYGAHGFVQRPSFNLSIALDSDSPPPVTAPQANLDEEEESEDDDDDDLDEDENDPWDIDMDANEDSAEPLDKVKEDLNDMLITHVSQGHSRARSFTAFLNKENILATYRPSHSALPQADGKAARIFCHFVSSTGPSMSIFERSATYQPGNPNLATGSGFQQPLWTYTLPSIALQHPALMHALLALASLHISKLQQTSPGPSIKHFTYALRRVGRLIGLPNRRNEVTTLAANLLLGFYEVMSAETSKWNIHLTGARVLAMEIDFAGKTRKIRALRNSTKSQLEQLPLDNQPAFLKSAGFLETLLEDREWDVDEVLISNLTGYQVRYDHQYQTNISPESYANQDLTAKDVELYHMQADLYWWYCKQDIFQSMLSGNRLLMCYDHWIFCPPRGQIGKLDLIYATMDHLCLIMARLADFGGKDSHRKRRAAANSQGDLGRGSGPSPSSEGPPLGYMPMSNEPPLHSAFATMSANVFDSTFSPPQSSANPNDEGLEAETAAAIAEHTAISQALQLFASSLPPEFDPLPPDAAPAISTPFGPALQYRTHTISCIWTFYYSGLILLARLHPSMPPAAMISAQIVAAQTAPYSQRIGKICAGLYYPQQYSLKTGNLNPNLGGALIESTFSLFFAAVQFTDTVQRGWTINKLKEIARLSGWQTAAAVAAGCEFAWQEMGRAGRGPEYRPTMDWRNKDERLGDKELKERGKAEKKKTADEAAERERERERERDVEKCGASTVEIGSLEEKDGEDIKEDADDRDRMFRQKELEERYFVAAGKDVPAGGQRAKAKMITGQDAGENSSNFFASMDIGRGPGAEFGENAVTTEEEDDDDEADPSSITHARHTIGTNPYARTHWALGLLSVDEDIAKIDLGKG